MMNRRKLKQLQRMKPDPEREAAYAADMEKQVAKARKIMATYDRLPPVVRNALAEEPTGSISVSDVAQLSQKISNNLLPVDHRHLADHVLQCARTIYRNMYGHDGMKKPPQTGGG